MARTTTHTKPVYYLTSVDNVAQTVIADGAGDVTVICTVIYAVEEITGGGWAGGQTACTPGANVNLYADGVDTLEFQVAANGAITVQRTAGADTFNVRLFLVWI